MEQPGDSRTKPTQRTLSSVQAEVAPIDEERGWLLGRTEDPFGHQSETGKPLASWPPTGGHTVGPDG